jgi:VWFA-related protein
MRGDRFRYAIEAVKVFGAAMQSGDQTAVVAFNSAPFVVAPLTANPDALTSAIVRVQPEGRTALYDGVSLALDVLDQSANGKSAVVLISDGNQFGPTAQDKFDSTPGFGSAERRTFRERRILERTRRSGTLVYAIGVAAAAAHSEDPATAVDPIALARLTEPTGGFSRNITSAADAPAAARLIRRQLDNQYVLGFVPEHHNDGKFHRVKVAVSGCKCRIRTRAGFVAAP